MKLLIHADPGARSGFIGSWLLNSLSDISFDVGIKFGNNFVKIHRLKNQNDIKLFNGVKLRIRPTLQSIDLHTLLFLRKNVHTQYPNFTKDEYSLETFTKLTEFAKEIFQWDVELDYSLYDHVMNFEDTFNIDYLVELYKKINGTYPTSEMIAVAAETNRINTIPLDNNHACSILKTVMTREAQLGLEEKNRFWSVVQIYQSTPKEQLHDAIYSSITPENYGILLPL